MSPSWLAAFRRHALNIAALVLGAAALVSGALSILMGSILNADGVTLSGWLVVVAVGLGAATFACVAASGLLAAYRQLRRHPQA